MNDKAYREPRHDMHGRECCDPARDLDYQKQGGGDAHDAFLAQMGAPPAPRGGHMDSVKAHEKKVKCDMTDERSYEWGTKAIDLPVKTPPKPDMPMGIY